MFTRLLKNHFHWLLVLAGAGILFARASSGLWDPWEMDRANLASDAAGRPKVLLLAVDSKVSERAQAALGAESFAVPVVSKGKTEDGRIIADAKRELDAGVFHAVLVDGGLVQAAPARYSDFADKVVLAAPGTEVLLFAADTAGCEAATGSLNKGRAQSAAKLLEQQGGRSVPPETAEAHAGAWPFANGEPCYALSEPGSVEALRAELSGLQWTRLQYKAEKAPAGDREVTVFAAPVLDYWLAGLSYRLFGFSEWSARLPSLLLGLALFILVLFFPKFLGLPRNLGLLAALLMLSTPMFVGQAKNIAGEISYSFFLSGAVLSFGWLAAGGPAVAASLTLAAFLTLLFLAKGLFGLLACVLVMVSYLVLEGRLRKLTLLPALLSVLLLGFLAVLVLMPAEWTFFSHFRFMNHPFNGGPDNYKSMFDYFLRQLGFGLFPWIIFVPMALAASAAEKDSSETPFKPGLLLVLWVLVPFLLHSAGIYSFRHCVYPAVPAVAIILARYFSSVDLTARNSQAAFFIAGMGAVIAAGLFKSTEALVTWLATDPHIKTSMKGLAGDTSEVSVVAKLLAACFLLLAVVNYGKLGRAMASISKWYRGGKALVSGLWILTFLYSAHLAWAAYSKFLSLRPGVTLSSVPVDLLNFHLEFLESRPDISGLIAVLVLLQLHALLVLTPLGGVLRRLWPSWCPLRRLCSWLAPRFGSLSSWIALLALLCGLAAFVDLLLTFPFQADGVVSLLFRTPGSKVAGGLVVFLVLVGVPLLRSRLRALLHPMMLALLLFLVAASSALFGLTDGRALDVPILVITAMVLMYVSWLPALSARPVLMVACQAGLLFWLALELTWPLLEAYARVEAQWPGHKAWESAWYLLLQNPVSKVGYILMGLSVLVPVLDLVQKRLAARGFARTSFLLNPVAWAVEAEKPTVFVVGLVLLGLAFSGWYGVSFLPAFSVEVSPKRMIERYKETEQTAALGDNIFKFRGDGRSGSDRNFYTAALPELTSMEDTLDLLLLSEDRQFKVSRSSSHPGPETVSLKAGTPARRYVVMSQESFLQADWRYRKLLAEKRGEAKDAAPLPHIPVLDASNKSVLLAVNELPPGAENENRFAKATISLEQFQGMKDVVKSYVNLEDKVHLLGFRTKERTLNRGSNLHIELFFHCVAPVTTSYKIFMHLDSVASGNRINGDHWPLNLEKDPEKKDCAGCWKTSNWMPGDVVIDSAEIEVPLGTPSGTQNIFMGLYVPGSGKRMKVLDYDKNVMHEGNDRFLIGSFEVN